MFYSWFSFNDICPSVCLSTYMPTYLWIIFLSIISLIIIIIHLCNFSIFQIHAHTPLVETKE